MKYLLSFAFILFLTSAAISQSKVDKINEQVKHYNGELKKAVDEEMEGIIPHIKTTCPLMLPAIGPVNHDIDIYFDLVQEEMELEGYEMHQYAIIRKVSFQLESGSYKFEYTYHFDKIGMLIFESERMEEAGEGCKLMSYYFDKEVCIFLRSELVASDFCEVPEDNRAQERTTLTDADKIAVRLIMNNSVKYKQLLALYTDIMIN